MAQIHAEDLVAKGQYKDIAAAQKFCDTLRDRAMRNAQYSKQNRPWAIVHFDKMLDKEQPWLGFEYETGFDKKEDYENVIAFLWDKQKYNAIDREGSGNYPFEVAFPPNTLAQFEQGKSNFQGYINFVEKKGLKQAMNPTTYTKRGIGIHVNISTPKSRALPGGRWDGPLYDTARKLNEWLKLGEAKEKELFGRFQRHWNQAECSASWIEFKLFQSTGDKAVLDGYVQVAKRLPALMDYALNGGKKPKNVYNFLSDKDKELKG